MEALMICENLFTKRPVIKGLWSLKIMNSSRLVLYGPSKGATWGDMIDGHIKKTHAAELVFVIAVLIIKLANRQKCSMHSRGSVFSIFAPTD